MPILTACTLLESLTTPSAGTDLPAEVEPSKVACEAFRPITYSSRDTPETQTEIVGHNAAYCAICGAYDQRCAK